MKLKAIAVTLFLLSGVVNVNANENVRSPYESMFELASIEFGVPASILKGIAFVESRWTQQNSAELEVSTEHQPKPYGIMGLRDDEWFGSSLRISANLVQLKPAILVQDARSNIRGAAAYLAELARLEGIEIDAYQESSQEEWVKKIGQWANVLTKYSGIPQAAIAKNYAHEVLKQIHYGYVGFGIYMNPEGRFNTAEISWLDQGGADPDPLGGGSEYPPAVWDRSPNYTPGAITPKYIVIHATEGSFAGAVSWLKNPRAQVSSHYVIRSSDGYLKQLVHEGDRAWHARCWNRFAIGIEHEAWTNTPVWYTKEMYNSSSKLVKYLAKKHKIPEDGLHIFGHDFWTKPEFKKSDLYPDLNCNTHADPGQYWNWQYFFDLITKTSEVEEGQTTPSGFLGF